MVFHNLMGPIAFIFEINFFKTRKHLWKGHRIIIILLPKRKCSYLKLENDQWSKVNFSKIKSLSMLQKKKKEPLDLFVMVCKFGRLKMIISEESLGSRVPLFLFPKFPLWRKKATKGRQCIFFSGKLILFWN